MDEEITDQKEVRLDKWLWATRFFKSRSLATEAVAGGKVHVNSQRTKPGRVVRVGDEVTISRGIYQWVVTVREVGRQRGPAGRASLLYEETEESKEKRRKIAEEPRPRLPAQVMLKGRPSKKERRAFDRFRRGDQKQGL